MHSRIFLLSDTPDTKTLDNFLLDEVEAAHEIGADYVTESESFKDDIKWLCDYLGIPYEITNGIGKIKKTDFARAIKEKKKKLIEKIKQSLTENSDIDEVVEEIRYIVNERGFYISMSGHPLEKIEYFDPGDVGSDTVYVHKTYDYHF